MKIPENLNWNLTPKEAIAAQARDAQRVRLEDDFGEVHYVAGVDVAFENDKTIARAAVVVLTFPALTPAAAVVARRPVTFPYVPGLLAYRELPAVLDAFRELELEPDLIIADAHAYAHPRRFGMTSQLGVLLDKPTIGCAKSILVGYAETPENVVGAWTPLIHNGEIIGAAVRTKLDTKRVTKPVYVSPGHRITLASSIEYVLRCCKGYRVPETTRYAHLVAGGAELELDKP